MKKLLKGCDIMDGFPCPYCSNVMAIPNGTYVEYDVSFNTNTSAFYGQVLPKNVKIPESCLKIIFYRCPSCNQYTIKAKGIGDKIKDVDTFIRPQSHTKHFPEYIPQTIRQDYEEACAIMTLSPKASATLSRRCLQGMIRDFWKIKKSNLFEEINALKDKIPADLWKSIDSLRQLGNIGAHMEKDTNTIIDIDPNEAESLVKLIELLMKEWYINREERKELFSNIINTNQSKQSERKKIE